MARRRKIPKTDPKLAVAYLRVSTDEQHLGPDAQRDAISTWAAREEIQIASWHVDEGMSGGVKDQETIDFTLEIERREGLFSALSSLQEHRAGWLIVAKRDRLGRDTMLVGMIERLVRRDGAQVVSTDGVSIVGGPEGVLMAKIIDAFAEYERLLISVRTRAALKVKQNRGERLGSIPYGFRAEGKMLVKDAKEQDILTTIRTLRAEGYSLRRIVSKLNNSNAPCRGSRWHLTTIAELLDN